LVKRRIYDDEKHIHFVTFSCYRRRNFLHPERVRSGESRKRSEILAIGDPQGVATFAGLVLVKTAFFRNAERSDSA